MLKFLLLFLVCIGFQESQAQDARFAQFYASPLNLNPAMTGVFEGRWRVIANYRDQWASILDTNPFRTISAGADMRFHIVGDDYVGVGITMMHDEAGDSKFSNNSGAISASYMKQLSGNRYRTSDQYLIAGGQIGGGQTSVDWSRLWFSRQFDVGQEIPRPDNINSGEVGINDGTGTSNLFIDINAGLMWYALMDDNFSIYAGGAMHHINQPKIALFDGENEDLYTRLSFHTGGEFPFTPELSLLPAINVMFQGPARSFMAGANFRYSNRDWYELAIRAGLWTHLSNKLEGGTHMDAIIFAAVLEMERFNLGISYDINASSLTTATNSRGAYELSFIYFQPAERRHQVKCPNF